jgi:AcrR family transcriptional regulator
MKKIDPRILRTRQLIVDSFISLVSEKDLNHITVRDITEKATINRATFYAHFTDKFDLLDFTITNPFIDKLKLRLHPHQVFNEEVIKNIFLSMCEYHTELSNLCPRNYQSLGVVIERKMKEELEKLIFDLLLKGSSMVDDRELLKTISIMLSWSIYGAAYTWNNDGRIISSEELVAKTIPILTNGIRKYFFE